MGSKRNSRLQVENSLPFIKILIYISFLASDSEHPLAVCMSSDMSCSSSEQCLVFVALFKTAVLTCTLLSCLISLHGQPIHA